MARCKICKKEYHACDSCDLMDWEYDYCSEECYTQGEGENTRQLYDKLVNAFGKEEAWQILDSIFNGSYMLEVQLGELFGKDF